MGKEENLKYWWLVSCDSPPRSSRDLTWICWHYAPSCMCNSLTNSLPHSCMLNGVYVLFNVHHVLFIIESKYERMTYYELFMTLVRICKEAILEQIIRGQQLYIFVFWCVNMIYIEWTTLLGLSFINYFQWDCEST